MNESGSDSPQLIVDVVPADPSKLWSVVGTILLLLLAFFSLLANPVFLWAVVLVQLVAVITARLFGRISPPRRHPLNSPLLLVYTIALLFVGVADMGTFGGLLLMLAALHAGLWLVRSAGAQRALTWGLLTLAALAGPLAWSQVGQLLPPDRFALFLPATEADLGWILAGSIVTFFPWLLTLRPPRRMSGLSLLVLLLAGLAAPNVFSSTLRSYDGFTISLLLDPYFLLLVLLLLYTAAVTIRRVIVERRRWRDPAELRGLLSAPALLVLLVFAMLFVPHSVGLRVWAFYGVLFAVGLSARELRVTMDPTRHPASRPAPLWAPFEEAWIAARSIVASLTARFRKPRFSNLDTPRRILEADGTLHVPYEFGETAWAPVVMHMHSNRWEGAFTTRELHDHYAALGASAVIVTDHNRITRTEHPVAGPPAYEHGWGPHNHHAILIGARKTLAERHAFGGNFASRIETLRRLRNAGEFIVLAHPGSSGAWPVEEVSGLDYDAIELFNKSYDDTAPWDEALTSGLLVWGTAGDDNHDLRSRHQTGKRFMLLQISRDEAEAPLSENRVLELISQGKFISCCLSEPPPERRITRHLPEPDMPGIARFDGTEHGVEVHFNAPVEKLTVLGPDGVVLNKAENASSIAVVPPPEASYARLEAEHGNWRIAMNPIAKIAKDATLPWR